MDRHDAEVNTILVFVSPAIFQSSHALTQAQSGLLAATVTAFFIFIQPQLQQDPNTFTATLLFVFINATNSTLLAEHGLNLDSKWSQTSPSLDVTQGFLLGSLLCTLLCVLGGVFTKIIPNSWVKFPPVDWFLRLGYVLVYLLLAAAFIALFVALNAAFPFKSIRF